MAIWRTYTGVDDNLNVSLDSASSSVVAIASPIARAAFGGTALPMLSRHA